MRSHSQKEIEPDNSTQHALDEARMHALLEAAVDAIIGIDESGVIELVNPAAERMFDYSAQDMVGKNVSMLMPSPAREEHDGYIARYLATGVKRIIGTSREVVALRRDGALIPMSLAVAEARLGDRRIFVGIHRDLAERKETEERFRLVVESMPNAIIMVNAEGAIVLVNTQTEKSFGYRREELIGRPVEVLVPERFRAAHPNLRAEYFDSPSPRPMGAGRDLHGRRKDGSEFPIEIGLTPIQTDAGVNVLSTIVDITERKRSEDELNASRQQLAADVEALRRLQEVSNRLLHGAEPEVLLKEILSAAVAITAADMGSIQLLDRNSDRLEIAASIGFDRPFLEFFQSVGRTSDTTCGAALVQCQRVVVEDVTASSVFVGTPALDVMLNAGARSVQSTPLLTRTGQLVGMLSTHNREPRHPAERDLHLIDLLARQAADGIERMRTEHELRQNHDRLQKLVGELQVKNEEIRSATQQLWHAAKLASVGELAASIAHELNNPLATVSLRIESLLANTPASDTRRRALEIVEQEAKRMASLVANLLQFSRRGVEEVTTVDIQEELKKAVELIHHVLRKRQINIVQDLAPNTPTIFADRQKLRQVFLNLVSNASDAMPTGGTLTLRAAPTTLDNGVPGVVLDFSDTGHGIPAELLGRIMEPFFTTKEEGKGTGLGLAICRRVVEEHRGAIQITSSVGSGTTIRLMLPLSNAANVSPIQGDQSEAGIRNQLAGE